MYDECSLSVSVDTYERKAKYVLSKSHDMFKLHLMDMQTTSSQHTIPYYAGHAIYVFGHDITLTEQPLQPLECSPSSQLANGCHHETFHRAWHIRRLDRLRLLLVSSASFWLVVIVIDIDIMKATTTANSV